MTKKSIIYKLIKCFLLGAIIIFFGIKMTYHMVLQEYNQVKNNVIVNATVLDCILVSEHDIGDGSVTRYYDVTVDYLYNNQSYNSVVHMVSSKPDIGETLSIHINPKSPSETHGVYGGIDDFIAPVIVLWVPICAFGIFIFSKANTYRMALSKDSRVVARVSNITLEDCHDEDGGTRKAHCVYVDYSYNGISHKNILWYSAHTQNKLKSTLNKELSQFPVKGENFEIYINPKKPDRILSEAPFKIVY